MKTRGHFIPGFVLLTLALLLGACRHSDSFMTGDGHVGPITPADITYNELAERYNATVEPLRTLWARTDVVIEWREEKQGGQGDMRREQGEGKLMLRQPGDTALLVEKLGKTLLWAGSNRYSYWLFDLVDGDNKRAYVGDFEKLEAPGRRAFPLPVRPDIVPSLLGLTPLPLQTSEGDTGSSVAMYNGQYLVVTPDQRVQLLIDPQAFRPTRIDLKDEHGYSVLTAKLEGTFPVEVPGVRKTRWPSMCERAEIYVCGYESRLTIAMDSATNDPNKLRDPMFNFDALQKALKPISIEQLDAE